MRFSPRLTTTLACTVLAPLAHSQAPAATVSAPATAPFAAPAAGASQPAASTVIVAGKRADVITKIDRKVYRADADLMSSSGNAADILNNIPSVDVDIDGNVSLRGDTSVTVLIDGKPSSQMQGAARGGALQGFSAADIEQIEVITSPSAEFKPDGAGGIINIVTKRNRRKGSAGQLIANVGNEGRRNAIASGSVNTGTLDLSGSVGDRRDTRRRTTDNETGVTGAGASPGGPTFSHQRLDETNERAFAKTALKYTPNDTQRVVLSLDYASRDERRIGSGHTGQAAANTGYERSSAGGGPRTDANASLSFDQKLAAPGEAVSLYLQRGHTVEGNLYDYVTRYAAGASGPSAAREQDFGEQSYDLSKLGLGYVRAGEAGDTLKLGYDIEANRNAYNNTVATAASASGTVVGNPAFDNRFRYRQTVNALYVTLGRKFGTLEVLGGLRAEQVDIHTLQRVSGDTGGQSYRKLYPTLNVLYPLSDSDIITGGYSKRVKKPDPDDLDPYINAADPNNLRQGNPTLRPQVTNALELGYRHEAKESSYSVTGFYRRSVDGDTEVLTPLSADVVLITKANLPASKAGGIDFTASGKLLPALGFNVNGSAFYNEVNAQAVGGLASRSTLSFNGKATLDYQAGAKDRLQLSANYRGKRLTAQGYVMPVGVVNLGYRHQADAQLTIVATVSDLFNGQRNRRVYDTSTFHGDYRRQQSGQSAYLGIAYAFGGAPKKARDDFSYD
jgi:outer membrane receptor protein involved in Fe transport